MTKDEKAMVVARLLELALLLGVEVNNERMLGYVENLKDVNIHAVLDGISSLIKSWKYPHFPNIADIREAAGCVDGGNPIESKAVVAWSKLRGKPGKAYDREGVVNDPIAKTVFNAMGGGYTTADGFGRWATDQEPWKRKEFIQLYLEAAKQAAAQPELSHQGGVGALVDLRMGGMGNA